MTGCRRAAAAAAVVACIGTVGCGDDPASAGSPSEQSTPSIAASPTTVSPTTTEPSTVATTASGCYRDMERVPIPPELSNLAFPDRTKIYDVEVRGDNGVLVTGVTNVLFRAAVYQMREGYSRHPFEIVDTDEGAGAVAANWSGASTSGRWVVSDISAVCPGDTEVRLLWTSAGSIGD